MTHLADNVRWLRTQRGLTQAELAGRIRVHRRATTPSYISRVESDTIDPRVSTVRSIARALRTPVWTLFVAVTENADFFDSYLRLEPKYKREVQRVIAYYARR